MGILNVTPDSFRRSLTPDWMRAAVDAALRDGGDRRGHHRRRGGIDQARRRRRRRRRGGRRASCPSSAGWPSAACKVPISIDTYSRAAHARPSRRERRSSTTSAACGIEPALGGVVAARGCGPRADAYPRPRSKGIRPRADYQDVVADVDRRARREHRRGRSPPASPGAPHFIDPGSGLLNARAHSYGVLARIPELVALGRPVLRRSLRASPSCVRRCRIGRRRNGTGEQPPPSRLPSWAARTSFASTPSPRWCRSSRGGGNTKARRQAESLKTAEI